MEVVYEDAATYRESFKERLKLLKKTLELFEIRAICLSSTLKIMDIQGSKIIRYTDSFDLGKPVFPGRVVWVEDTFSDFACEIAEPFALGEELLDLSDRCLVNQAIYEFRVRYAWGRVDTIQARLQELQVQINLGIFDPKTIQLLF